MNRRSSIKNLALIGVLGFSSFSIVKWFNPSKTITIGEIDMYKSLIAELCETIIPRTETAGAKDSKVEEFVILMIRDCNSERNQRNFLNGLINLKEYAQDNYETEFENCTITDKMNILKHFEGIANSDLGLITKLKRKIIGKPFFNQLKDLTVEGFCTSELGATEVLAYDYIPGSFQSCIQLQAGQKSWATK